MFGYAFHSFSILTVIISSASRTSRLSPHASIISYFPATFSANSMKSNVNAMPFSKDSRVQNADDIYPSPSSSDHLCARDGNISPYPSDSFRSTSKSFSIVISGSRRPSSFSIITSSLKCVCRSSTTITPFGMDTGIDPLHTSAL